MVAEREKALASQLYCSGDAEITAIFRRAQELTYRYNNLEFTAFDEKQAVLKELFGHLGENVSFAAPIKVDSGVNTFIGNNCYFNFDVTILDTAEIHIGNNVLVGPNVSFFSSLHPLVADERRFTISQDGKFCNQEYAKPITIGNDVWIAGNVTINGGVTIGECSVIGSGSVVTHNIPEGVLAAGVPCRVIREITENDRMGK